MDTHAASIGIMVFLRPSRTDHSLNSRELVFPINMLRIHTHPTDTKSARWSEAGQREDIIHLIMMRSPQSVYES